MFPTWNSGHGIKVKDIPPFAGVEFLTLPETIVVNVVAPKVEEVKPAATGHRRRGEPPTEVITKGKKEEGVEGAAATPGAAPAAAGPPSPKKRRGKRNNSRTAPMAPFRLVLGLGQPGSSYRGTRHTWGAISWTMSRIRPAGPSSGPASGMV